MDENIHCWGRITVRLVSCLTGLDSGIVSGIRITCFLVWSNPIQSNWKLVILSNEKYISALEHFSTQFKIECKVKYLASRVTRKNRQMFTKVAQNNFTRKKIKFNTFKKIS